MTDRIYTATLAITSYKTSDLPNVSLSFIFVFVLTIQVDISVIGEHSFENFTVQVIDALQGIFAHLIRNDKHKNSKF